MLWLFDGASLKEEKWGIKEKETKPFRVRPKMSVLS